MIPFKTGIVFRKIFFFAFWACFLPLLLQARPIQISGKRAELTITPVSEYTLRISLRALNATNEAEEIEDDRVLVKQASGKPVYQVRQISKKQIIHLKKLTITVNPFPLTIDISTNSGKNVQRLTINEEDGMVSFVTGSKPVFGLGGGGQNFDRRGVYYSMSDGFRAGEYPIFGSRLSIPFLIGTQGWSLFFHRPYNAHIDLRSDTGKFIPPVHPKTSEETALPLDFFITCDDTPSRAMAEYDRITGKPVMPPKWALGYLQSHRTLSGPKEIIDIAKTFRKKNLPADGLIYLGTGYCPAGWNLGHGSLQFNPETFDHPKQIIDSLHAMHFHVVLHVNRPPHNLHGHIPPTTGEPKGPDHIAEYWKRHISAFTMGTDGWWPDDGDALSIDARLARHAMYYRGPLSDRPNMRPFSLHRTGYAGMQRYGGWIWSGDVFSLWKTLSAQVTVGINFSLSASPFWGTDIGGFSPTKELTGELYARWFEFGAFCPLFRSHGRDWHLHLPWGWNTGEIGPDEVVKGFKGTASPDTSELHNAMIEPICKEYLDLRYRLMPYLYTMVREAHDTGMPIMRAMWLEYPGDSIAVQQNKQYLWGRDMLIAPVVREGETERSVYLPKGLWYDFWSNRTYPGHQTVKRYVDLSTIPVYVRAGTILPLAPLRQYTEQTTNKPMTLRVYSGKDGSFTLYDDDGKTLNYLKGEATWTTFKWNDEQKKLTIEPSDKSDEKMIKPQQFDIVLIPGHKHLMVTYTGKKCSAQYE